ncbi:MAG: hypothetical protein R3D70_22540 [Rhizobiaceae bacterium]|jgi:hypothetical protein
MLIAQLSGLRVNVLANRLACESDLARSVHDKLASTLAAMIEDQRKIRKAESNAVMARGTLDQDDARLDLYDYQVAYHDRWLAETIDLLDGYVVDEFTHEYYNFHTRSWHHRDTDVPIAVPLAAEKLCGLSSVIAEIEDVSGARFGVDRVYYSEAEAEEAWLQDNSDHPAAIA